MIKDQRGALVGGEAPGKADRERIGVEQVIERNKVLWLRAVLLILQPPPRELDQLAPQAVAQRPKLFVADKRRTCIRAQNSGLANSFAQSAPESA